MYPSYDSDGTLYVTNKDGTTVDMNGNSYVPVHQRAVPPAGFTQSSVLPGMINSIVTSTANNKRVYYHGPGIQMVSVSKESDSLLAHAIGSTKFDANTAYSTADYKDKCSKALERAGTRDVCWNKRYRTALLDLGLTLQPYQGKTVNLTGPQGAPDANLNSDYPWDYSLIVYTNDETDYNLR